MINCSIIGNGYDRAFSSLTNVQYYNVVFYTHLEAVGESSLIRSKWTGGDFGLDTIMWVENDGSLLCSEWFCIIVLRFYPLTKFSLSFCASGF